MGAWLAGTGWEALGAAGGQSALLRSMDMHNNSAGRCLSSNEKHCCEALCDTAVSDGTLRVLRRWGDPPTSGPDIPWWWWVEWSVGWF